MKSNSRLLESRIYYGHFLSSNRPSLTQRAKLRVLPKKLPLFKGVTPKKTTKKKTKHKKTFFWGVKFEIHQTYQPYLLQKTEKKNTNVPDWGSNAGKRLRKVPLTNTLAKGFPCNFSCHKFLQAVKGRKVCLRRFGSVSQCGSGAKKTLQPFQSFQILFVWFPCILK